MAAMHEHIYKHDGYASVDAKSLVPAIVDEVVAAYGSDAKVTYTLSSVQVGRDQATPLALLLSEWSAPCFDRTVGIADKA